MSDFPTTARVVIIGGGVVGASSLYHLAKAGWTDCVLLEKNELTAGSTWHAAGNVPTFSTSWSIMNMQRYSTELYSRLGEEVDYPMNYHVTGSIRLAHSKERMQEFERAAGMGRYQGMDIEILSNKETQKRYPFLETHDMEGSLYDPHDGDIDPAQLTQALAKGARDMGQKILRFTPATGVTRDGNEWIVHTDKGDIRCEFVVNAAGYYAQRVGEWFKPYGGRTVPMMVMSHQYLLSEEVPELAAHTKEFGKLPLLRDVDSSYYLRQEKNGFNLGPYEGNCRAHWVDPSDPMPDDFSFQLYPDDLDRIEWHIEDAMARVPLLGSAGISRVINGPIPYAPDGLPLVGPMPGVPNAFEACVFTFGIAQGGGAGKVLAEWITQGVTEWDMWAIDPRRYTDYTDQDYCNKKGMEVYGNEYAMHFPNHEWPAARDKKLSPVHDRVKASGGVMGAYNGWERANWFAKEGDDTSLEATHTWGRSGPWEQRIKEECEAVRDGCGVLDLPGFARFMVSGPGTAEFLRGFCTGGLPKVGRMNLIYVSDKRGRILSEMSCVRMGDDDFMLITASTAQWHDRDLLINAAPEGVSIKDVTTTRDTLIVTGPKSRDVLASMTDADLSSGWLTHQSAVVAGQNAYLIRVSFAGELGWEVHALNDDMPMIYDAVIAAGAKPFGMYALNSLRLEKGYRAWKGDLSTDYSMLEGGLERFVKLDKPQDFKGKAAIQNEKQQGRKKAFITLLVDADDCDAPYMSTLWLGDKVVGETTSGAWGYRINASIALGMVRADLATPGTELQVEIYGKRCRAVVQEDRPLWDPENERLRGCRTIPELMSGVLLTGHGGPEALKWSDAIPVPKPGAGQVLVRVLAAAINNTDINTRIGWYSSDVTSATEDVSDDTKVEEGGWGGALNFPIIQGGDICGEVVSLGEGVTTRAIGMRVTSQINIPRPTKEKPTGFVALGSEIDGAFAQYCLLEADETFDVSRSPLSNVEIAAIPCAYGTAFNMLTRAGVQAGHDVLVTGASGGVGMAAVQLAKNMGANVCGIAANHKADAVRAAGAQTVLDRTHPVPHDSFDVVVDVVAGSGWQQLILGLRAGGHYAVSGAIAGPIIEADLRDIYLRDITIHGASYMARAVFYELVEMINNGNIKPLISKTYPLCDIVKGQEEFVSKSLPGKLVLIPPGVNSWQK